MVRKTAESYGGKLLAVQGENLLSMAVYGSAVTGGYVQGRSNINILAVFERLGIEELEKSRSLVRQASGSGRVTFLFLTPETIRRSTDTFPIEYIDMKEDHVTIYGEDLLNDLNIDPRNLRLQCEREIKGKLILFRNTYLETSTRSGPTSALLSATLTSLFPVFRGLLRLKRVEPEQDRERLIRQVASEFSLNGDPFIQVWEAKSRKRKLDKDNMPDVVAGFLSDLEILATASDDIKVRAND
jgi:hypothetical protein